MKNQKHGRLHPRSGFSPEEDCLLIDLVTQFGSDSWATIASFMEGRNPRQCKDRYTSYLSPTINNSPYTEEEDILLRKKYEEFGSKWVKISKFFPNRTDISVKCRWAILNRRDMKTKTKSSRFSLNDFSLSENEPISSFGDEKSMNTNSSSHTPSSTRSRRGNTKQEVDFPNGFNLSNQNKSKKKDSSIHSHYTSKSNMVTRKRTTNPPSYKDEDDTFELAKECKPRNIDNQKQPIFPNPMHYDQPMVNFKSQSSSFDLMNLPERANSHNLFITEDGKLNADCQPSSIQSTLPVNHKNFLSNSKFNVNYLYPHIYGPPSNISQVQTLPIDETLISNSLYLNSNLPRGDSMINFGNVQAAQNYQHQYQISNHHPTLNNSLIIPIKTSEASQKEKAESPPVSISDIQSSIAHQSGNQKQTPTVTEEFFVWDLNWDFNSADLQDDQF